MPQHKTAERIINPVQKRARYGPAPRTVSEFFYHSTVSEIGCWITKLAKSRNGVCYTKWDRVSISSHRLAWILYNGPTNGLHVLHSCDDGRCINPHHMFLGTHQDNMADMVSKGRNRHGIGGGRPRKKV